MCCKVAIYNASENATPDRTRKCGGGAKFGDGGGGREACVCARLCVCVREREREREFVCVCVYARACRVCVCVDRNVSGGAGYSSGSVYMYACNGS